MAISEKTGYFNGIRNILCLWGDLLVLITGITCITRAITCHNCSDDKTPLASTVSMGDPQVSTVHDLDDGFGVPP